jgi:hypothetical protein
MPITAGFPDRCEITSWWGYDRHVATLTQDIQVDDGLGDSDVVRLTRHESQRDVEFSARGFFGRRCHAERGGEGFHPAQGVNRAGRASVPCFGRRG